jgi:AbiV family abortive infection protein
MQREKGYSGPLDALKVAEGINAANRNAQRLATDARILLDVKRYPTAAALAALSIEEGGKSSILRGLALAPG